MKPAPFEYHRPSTVDEAVGILAANDGRTEVLAGGQSLIPMMNFRRKDPTTLVDINRIDDLDYIRRDDGALAIGAMTRQADLEKSSTVREECPLVAEALSYVGHKPTRHRGTIGGNMANADPASELPAVAVAQDARFVAQGPEGDREIAAGDFFRGSMETDLRDDELLTEIRIPTLSDDTGYEFVEQRPRDHGWAVAGLAATIEVEDGTVDRCRLVYTGVADRPLRIEDAEDELVGETPDADAFEAAAAVAGESVDPPSQDEVSAEDLKNNQRTGPTEHPHASLHAPPEFRTQLVETFTRRALENATERAGVS